MRFTRVSGVLWAATTALVSAQSEPDGGVPATNYIIASATNVSNVSLQITTQDQSRRNKTAPLLYGLMHEDIDHSGDGGIYAELIANRAFQGSPISSTDNPIEPYAPTLDRWQAIGNTTIALDKLHPLSDALPNSMMVVFPPNATGKVGILNTGFWGMDVTPQTYTGSFWVHAINSTYPSLDNKTDITVDLRSNLTDDIWVSKTVEQVHINTWRYSQINFTLENNATAPNANNTFAITFEGEQVAGQTFYFSLVSLFPETFKNRTNGLRKDIAEAFYAIKPGFLRCPGGNNLEGNTIETRFKWWESIGPLENRPGRIGTWGYYNTNGLGLMEYLAWCEDMEMEPLLAVVAGYGLDGTSYPEQYMDEVLSEIMDELEFCLGDQSTKWGQKRAEYGHPDPYKINYVEIGNEDFFSCTYQYRLNYLYGPLKQKYPNIRFISTQYNENEGGGNAPCNVTVPIPQGSGWDFHTYKTPSYYLENFDIFDNFEAINNVSNIELALAEYSVFQLDTSTGYVNFSDPPDIHPPWPQMIHAVGEGVYQLAAERNPGLVTLSAYAPTLQNLNAYVWTPNLIVFQAQQNLTVLSTSYWQQWLFGNYRGSHVVPVEGTLNPLYWVGTIDDQTGSFYLKIVNTGNRTIPLTLNFDSSYSNVNGTILQSDDPNGYNTVENQHLIEPRTLNGSDLPTRGTSGANASASTGAMSASTAAASSVGPSMGSQSLVSTKMGASETGSASVSASAGATVSAAAKRGLSDFNLFKLVRRQDNGGNGTSGSQSGGGGNTWSWTVPVFSSTVLQFDP